MRAANLIAHKAPESCKVDGLGLLSRDVGDAIRGQREASVHR